MLASVVSICNLPLTVHELISITYIFEFDAFEFGKIHAEMTCSLLHPVDSPLASMVYARHWKQPSQRHLFQLPCCLEACSIIEKANY
jgi:hypothetical protein